MNYTLSYENPTVDDYYSLVKECDLIVKDKEAIEIGLKNGLFTITIYQDNSLIGMGRVVGDGATVFHIIDVAVSPRFQGKGLGKTIMDNIMEYINDHSFKGTYVNLIAETPANYLYEKYGFQYEKDHHPAMYIEFK